MEITKEYYLRLVHDVNYHNHRYHVMDDPVISDSEYDALLKQIRSAEEEHPEWVAMDSPTKRAGSAISSKFRKVKHANPVLSLANAFGAGDANAWYERIVKLDDRVTRSGFVVEPKIDGLSVVLRYQNGVFVQGATRGDGLIGEDITANLRTVFGIPLSLPVDSQIELTMPIPTELVVRGEVFIFNKDFERLNAELKESGQKTYQNPRNTAAGSLRQLDPTVTAKRPLAILVYQILHHSGGDIPTTQAESLAWLKQIGFPIAEVSSYFQTFKEAVSFTEKWETKRDELGYEADGMVIKLNDLDTAVALGYVGKDPRGAIAFKFPGREVTTTLRDIGLTVGRTGVITPYAILEGVNINGVFVERATLHNFDFIFEKDIRVGDRVLVKRAGEVIPYIIGPITDLRAGSEQKYVLPEVCPECGTRLEKVAGEVALFCTNSTCPARILRGIEHFVSKGAMDIVGMGGKIVEKLIESGAVKDVADIYGLDVAKISNALTQKERKSEKEPPGKMAENILAAIEASRTQPLRRLITALGISNIGEVAANDLANHFGNLEAIFSASSDELIEIEGMGPTMAQAIIDWYESETNKAVLAKFKNFGVWPTVQKSSSNDGAGVFSGKTFVVTGTLPTLGRDSVKALIETNGGKVTDSVSKNTSYLVLGDKPGSKHQKAMNLNVPILSEADLFELISKGNE